MRADRPSASTWAPTIANIAAAISVCRNHRRPRISTSLTTTSAASRPAMTMAAPGTTNSQVGEWTSRKRRWRQPSDQADSLDSPARGW